jgi:nucleoside-diphosphate-sugar epimerase
MSSPIKNVIVAGASGSIGPSIIASLLSNGFSVSVLTRETSTATFSNNVTVHRTDYSAQSLLQAFKGQDAVVSALATTAGDQQVRLIDAAIAAGVERFIPSEFGIDTSDPAIADLIPPTQGKLDTVRYLRTKENEGLSWTSVCVGAIFDWTFQHPGLMGWNVPARKATIFDGGNTPFEATNLDQIGTAIAAILMPENFDETKNQFVYINSFTVTQSQILKGLEKVTGDCFAVEYVASAEVMRQSLKQMQSPSDPQSEGDSSYSSIPFGMIAAAIYNHGGFNNFSATKGLWNKRLRLPDGDLEATLARVI